MRPLLFIAILSLCVNPALHSQDKKMPKVFQLGENEKGYEALTQIYNRSLLEISGSNMKMAMDNWLQMMQDMENYADSIGYNLKGIKVWLHVFWNQDGGVDHLGFLLREDSRNVKTEDLKAFFTSFINQYKTPLTSDRPFSHYTGATFPTFVEKVKN